MNNLSNLSNLNSLNDFGIDDLREEIDKIDANLLSLFENRMEVVLKIAEYKIKNNIEILNESREESVIQKNLNQVKNKDLLLEVEDFFKSVMEISRDFQEKKLNNYDHEITNI